MFEQRIEDIAEMIYFLGHQGKGVTEITVAISNKYNLGDTSSTSRILEEYFDPSTKLGLQKSAELINSEIMLKELEQHADIIYDGFR
jgi:hypothetical protein